MLPKVANQLIHHTSRAVAAVQNQTGHTIRNVLHLQPTPSAVGNRNGPGSSSSGRGGNGAGAGGARHSGSSRFYSNYSVSSGACICTRVIESSLQALSRSVTQADPSLLHSVTIELADDSEEAAYAALSSAPAGKRRIRQRPRSSSFTLGSHERDVKAEKTGLLQALQQHVRARHAFAVAPAAPSHASEAEAEQSKDAPASGTTASSSLSSEEEQLVAAFRDAKVNGDGSRVLALVERIRKSEVPHSVQVYNAAMNAFTAVRKTHEPLTPILDLYNDMVSRSVIPDIGTYTPLILSLTSRDQEVVELIEYLEKRATRKRLAGQYSKQLQEKDDNMMLSLRKENNFSSAMVLFQAGSLLPYSSFNVWVYSSLLRSCAVYGHVNAALRVFGHMEKRKGLQHLALPYKYLLETYSKSGNLPAAIEVFNAYVQAAKAGKISREELEHSDEHVVQPWRANHVGIWNSLITAYFNNGQPSEALGVLEQMLGPDASPDFTLEQIPSPCPATYTGVIQGFIASGDLDSAITWFDRLLQERDLPSQNPTQSSSTVTKPHLQAWRELVQALAIDGSRLTDLNRLVELACKERLADIPVLESTMVVHANLRHLDTLLPTAPEAIVPALKKLMEIHGSVFDSKEPFAPTAKSRDAADEIGSVHLATVKLLVGLGEMERAVDLLERYATGVLQRCAEAEATGAVGAQIALEHHSNLRYFLVESSAAFFTADVDARSLKTSMRLARIADQAGLPPRAAVAAQYLSAYVRASDADKALVSPQEWCLLLEAAVNAMAAARSAVENPLFQPLPESFDIFQLVSDMAAKGVDLNDAKPTVFSLFGSAVSESYDPDTIRARLEHLPPAFRAKLESTLPRPRSSVQKSISPGEGPELLLPETASSQKVQIDRGQHQYIEECLYANNMSALTAYSRFETGAQLGLYPRPEVIGRLISALGRLGDVEKVHKAYAASQLVLAAMGHDKPAQSLAWFQVEDQMIIGLAHAGDPQSAHVHRLRILEQGGVPSADAYGALIEHVKDTTDDTNGAMALFEEAVAAGVHPNIYLYNTAISKLAKARKADHALALFEQMKSLHIRPTSVTYGALIAACCRVGDVASAEALFNEMTSQPNFKPRVPPYNTMMQMYTHTKPDRHRVLHYYNELLRANVKPTAHTYKVRISRSLRYLLSNLLMSAPH